MVGWIGWGLAVAALGAEFTEVQPGVQYDAGSRVGMAELGLSFEVPSGWLGGIPEGAEVMLLASETETGVVVVTADVGLTADTAKAVFAEPIPLDMLTIAQPTGTPTLSGRVVSQTFEARTPQGVLHGVGRGYLAEGGSGLAFVALGPDRARAEALAKALVGSVKEHEAPAAAPAAAAPTGSLAAALKGTQLLYMKTENGFSDEQHIYLCSSGEAASSSENSAISFGGGATATMAGQGSASGSWAIRGGQVVVTLGGETHTFPVALREDGSVGVQLDNWWVQPQSQCP